MQKRAVVDVCDRVCDSSSSVNEAKPIDQCIVDASVACIKHTEEEEWQPFDSILVRSLQLLDLDELVLGDLALRHIAGAIFR